MSFLSTATFEDILPPKEPSVMEWKTGPSLPHWAETRGGLFHAPEKLAEAPSHSQGLLLEGCPLLACN